MSMRTRLLLSAFLVFLCIDSLLYITKALSGDNPTQKRLTISLIGADWYDFIIQFVAIDA